ncbi:MAG: TolB family protein [Candidatus Sericytochromatia bacterium]
MFSFTRLGLVCFGMAVVSACQPVAGIDAALSGPTQDPGNFRLEPSWSPDAHTLLLAVQRNSTGLGSAATPRKSVLYTLNTASGKLEKRVEADVSGLPFWSEDSQNLIYWPLAPGSDNPIQLTLASSAQVPYFQSQGFDESVFDHAAFTGLKPQTGEMALLRNNASSQLWELILLAPTAPTPRIFNTGIRAEGQPSAAGPDPFHRVRDLSWSSADTAVMREQLSYALQDPDQALLGRENYYLLHTNGQAAELLLSLDNSGSSSMDLSASGESLLLDTWTQMQTGKEVGIYDNSPKSEIIRLDLASRSRRTLTQGSWPRWSPDGQQIAFLRADGVYVANANGEQVRQLVPSAGYPEREAFQLRWSPDGKQVHFLASRPQRNSTEWRHQLDFSLYHADVATGQLQEVKPDLGAVYQDYDLR